MCLAIVICTIESLESEKLDFLSQPEAEELSV